MEAIRTMLNQSLNVLSSIQVTDIIDILIVAFLVYKAFSLVRRTNSTNLARGILILVAVFILSEIFGLKMMQFLLRRAFELGLIALVILFQPELRRLLERVGSTLNTRRGGAAGAMEECIEQTVRACVDMAATTPPTGALIAFAQALARAVL